jgi:hypothetical protein
MKKANSGKVSSGPSKLIGSADQERTTIHA